MNIEVCDLEELNRDMLSSKICSDQSRQIVAIKYSEIMRDLASSFRHPNDIWRQFTVDLSRIRVTLDGVRIEDPEVVKDYLFFRYGSEYATVIAMHCTQVVMGLPLELLQSDSYYVGELGYDQSYDSDLHIKVKLEQSSFSFQIEKILRYFVITDASIDRSDQTIAIIKVSIDYPGGDYTFISFENSSRDA